ncbi:MAG: hypothetical protein K2X86_18290 [Cytophagaceae bacterium]|nr:hypothetical protein [Cytophagaceae bacterium]
MAVFKERKGQKEYMQYSDQEIIDALKKGNNDKVLSFLYKEVLPKVKYYIKKIKGMMMRRKTCSRMQ